MTIAGGGLLLALGAVAGVLLVVLPQPIAVPDSFAGTWYGLVKEPEPKLVIPGFNASLSLASGTSPGTITYQGPRFSCTGHLTATAVGAGVLTVHQLAPDDQRRGATQGIAVCGTGTLIVRLIEPRSSSAHSGQALSLAAQAAPRLSVVYQFQGRSAATSDLVRTTALKS